MVTRRNRPDSDASSAEGDLHDLLAEKTLEVARLRRRLENLESLGAGFLSSASHAATNPVTIIQSYLEIILSDLQAGFSPEQVEFVKTAHAATLRLNRLIASIVELAALEMGVAELEMSAVDAGDLVAEVSKSYAASAETGGVQLSVSISPHLPRVRADGDRLRNSIGEVVLNAVQWTDSGGRVEITAVHVDREVIVAVVDTGRGIPEDRLEEIFAPFIRLSGQDGTARRGSGLGLSVARRQIEAMGGYLTLSSEVGRGTSVEISLPVLTEDA